MLISYITVSQWTPANFIKFTELQLCSSRTDGMLWNKVCKNKISFKGKFKFFYVPSVCVYFLISVLIFLMFGSSLREYARSESEKSFDECEMRRARLKALGLAYLSPQNKSLAQSFRYPNLPSQSKSSFTPTLTYEIW